MIAKPTRRAALIATSAALAALLLSPGFAAAAPFALGAQWGGVNSSGVQVTAPFVVAADTGNDPFNHAWAFSADGLRWAIPTPGGGTTEFNPGGLDFVADRLEVTVAGTALAVSAAGTFFQTGFGDWEVTVAGDTVTFIAPAGLQLVGDPFFPSAFAAQVALAAPSAVPAPPAAMALGLGLLGLAAVARRPRHR